MVMWYNSLWKIQGQKILSETKKERNDKLVVTSLEGVSAMDRRLPSPAKCSISFVLQLWRHIWNAFCPHSLCERQHVAHVQVMVMVRKLISASLKPNDSWSCWGRGCDHHRCHVMVSGLLTWPWKRGSQVWGQSWGWMWGKPQESRNRLEFAFSLHQLCHLGPGKHSFPSDSYMGEIINDLCGMISVSVKILVDIQAAERVPGRKTSCCSCLSLAGWPAGCHPHSHFLCWGRWFL